MFGAKFPLPVLNEKINFTDIVANIPANTTCYLCSCDQSEGVGTYNVNETVMYVNYLVTRTGLLRNLRVFAHVAPGAGETFVYTVRINGVNTAVTVTLTGATKNGSDLINTAEVIIGDRVTLQLITSLAAGAGKHSVSICTLKPSTRIPYECMSFSSGSTTIPVATTTAIMSSSRGGLGASVGGTGSESISYFNHLVTRKGTLKNLVVLAGAAPGAGQTFVYYVRVNYVNMAMTVTLSGAAQVTGTDIVNVVQVDPGDVVTIRVTTSAAATVTTHAASFDFEEGDYRAG